MYTNQMKQRRIAMALEVIHEMVKNGFTFFSSVLIDTSTHKHIYSDFALSDSMFFHIPGKAAIVRVSVVERIDQFDEITHTQYLNAEVCLEQMAIFDNNNRFGLSSYNECFSFAKANGYTKKVSDQYGWCDHEMIDLPYFRRDPLLERWTYHGGGGSGDVCSIYLESSKPHMKELSVGSRVCELAKSVTELIPVLKDGQFSELQVTGFYPGNMFRECAPEFWSKFNTRYFRQLAHRTFG